MVGSDGGAGAAVAMSVAASVVLRIYDVTRKQVVHGVNDVLQHLGGGAYHAGVEIYCKEYSFGGGFSHKSGVNCCQPKRNSAHRYRKGIRMGTTIMSEDQVKLVIAKLEESEEWRECDYDLLRRNCCHFCNTLCQKLGVGSVPAWVTELAGICAGLRSGLRVIAPKFVGGYDHLFRPEFSESEEEQESEEEETVSPPTIPAVGSRAEIFSNSGACWFAGTVLSVQASLQPPHIEVEFWVSGKPCFKVLPLGHSQLRILRDMPQERSAGYTAAPLLHASAAPLQACPQAVATCSAPVNGHVTMPNVHLEFQITHSHPDLGVASFAVTEPINEFKMGRSTLCPGATPHPKALELSNIICCFKLVEDRLVVLPGPTRRNGFFFDPSDLDKGATDKVMVDISELEQGFALQTNSRLIVGSAAGALLALKIRIALRSHVVL